MATSEIFMLLALVSTGIFLLQFVISIFFGGLDIDVDGDTNVDFDLGSLFSFKGLIHFLIGSGKPSSYTSRTVPSSISRRV